MNLFVLFLGQATYLSSEVAVDDISSWLLNLNWVMPSYLGPLTAGCKTLDVFEKNYGVRPCLQ